MPDLERLQVNIDAAEVQDVVRREAVRALRGNRRPAQDMEREPDDVYLLNLPQSEFEQHISRKGIGGSDISAIVGLSRWMTREDCWKQKMGMRAPQSDNADRRRGRALEQIAVDEYELATSRECSPGYRIQRPNERWMRGTPDRFIRFGPRPDAIHPDRDGILEVKCLRLDGFYRTRDEGIDPGYYCQLQWYMHVGHYQWGAFCVFNAEDWALHHFDVIYDPVFCGWLEAQARQFWNYNILGRNTPSPTDTPTLPVAIAENMRSNNGAQTVDVESLHGVENRAPWRVALEQLKRTRAELKLAERADEIAEQRVKEMMETVGYEAIRGFGCSISYREQTRTTLDRDALAAAHPELDLEPFMRQSASRPFRFSLRMPGDTRRSARSTANPEEPRGVDAHFEPTVIDSLSASPRLMEFDHGATAAQPVYTTWSSTAAAAAAAAPPLTAQALQNIVDEIRDQTPGERPERLNIIDDRPLPADGDEATEAVEAPRRARRTRPRRPREDSI